jgi:uncharacterized protein
MFISVQDLEVRDREFDERYEPGQIDLGPDAEQIGVLTAKGKAELLEEHRGGKQIVSDIRIRGTFATEVEMKCARCIEPVREKFAGEFDLLYRPEGLEGKRDEVSISEAETEIGYYSGDGMQLEDALAEQVLLSLPGRVVCKEDCKGLCPHCGKNLNAGACDCRPVQSDPRWAALEDIRKKLDQ